MTSDTPPPPHRSPPSVAPVGAGRWPWWGWLLYGLLVALSFAVTLNVGVLIAFVASTCTEPVEDATVSRLEVQAVVLAVLVAAPWLVAHWRLSRGHRRRLLAAALLSTLPAWYVLGVAVVDPGAFRFCLF